MRCSRRQPGVRRGATWPAVLWALFVAGTVVTTAVVVTPRYLQADVDAGVVSARVEEHQQIFALFVDLVSRSKEVVVVNPRGATPFLELVLWLEDSEHIGVIDLQEIAVITHSEVLQTITMHTFDASAVPRDRLHPSGGDETPETLERSDMLAPGFCAAFRDRPGVTRRLLARGIAQLDAEPHVDSTAGRAKLRISFTWDEESADGGDEASALTDVHMRTENGA